MAIEININSYVTELELTEYASERGITIDGDESILLFRAMDVLETMKYLGYKVSESQPLQFPRYGISTYTDYTVPKEVKTAQIMLAIAIGEGADYMEVNDLADYSRIKIAVLEVETRSSTTKPLPPMVTKLLSPFMMSGTRLVRG